jgi:hypothetical protein
MRGNDEIDLGKLTLLLALEDRLSLSKRSQPIGSLTTIGISCI